MREVSASEGAMPHKVVIASVTVRISGPLGFCLVFAGGNVGGWMVSCGCFALVVKSCQIWAECLFGWQARME